MEKFSVDSEKRDAQEEHGNSEGSRRVLYIPAYAVHTLASFALIYGLIRYRGITFLDQHLFFVGMADALAIFVMVSWATIILAERFSQPEARER